MRDILHICCQIQRMSAGLRNVNFVSCQTLCRCSLAFLVSSIQFTVSPLLLLVWQQFDAQCTPHLLPNTGHLHLSLCQLGSRQIQYYCSTTYPGFNIQLNVSPFPLKTCQQYHARYAPHLLTNTAHLLLFTFCQLGLRTSPMLLQYCTFCIKYSIERISVSIPDVATIRCALYLTFAVKYSAHQLVCAMSSVCPVKSSVTAVLEILQEIFNWRYLCFHWRHVENSMRVMPHISCLIQCTSAGNSTSASGHDISSVVTV
jgi:hypothetical protein